MTDQPWMITYSGGRFNFLDPREDDIHLIDIAHHLSLKNRFNGATEYPYSVAQHSLLVAASVPHECKRVALLHDAAEAYLPDVHTQLKDMLQGFRKLEHSIQTVIFRRFGVDQEEVDACSKIVKSCDLKMLATEKKNMLRERADKWPQLEGIEDLNLTIFPTSWKEIKPLFIKECERLFEGASDPVNHFSR